LGRPNSGNTGPGNRPINPKETQKQERAHRPIDGERGSAPWGEQRSPDPILYCSAGPKIQGHHQKVIARLDQGPRNTPLTPGNSRLPAVSSPARVGAHPDRVRAGAGRRSPPGETRWQDCSIGVNGPVNSRSEPSIPHQVVVIFPFPGRALVRAVCQAPQPGLMPTWPEIPPPMVRKAAVSAAGSRRSPKAGLKLMVTGSA